MKTQMMSVTLAVVLGIAGVTSAFANDVDSNEWRQQLRASSSQTVQASRLLATDTADTGTTDGTNSTAPCQSPCH